MRSLHVDEEFEELPDRPPAVVGVVSWKVVRVRQRELALDLIAVTPADPLLQEVARGVEVGDHRESSALGDVESRGDISQPGIRVGGDEEHRSGVVGEERPVDHWPIVVEF